MLKHQHRITILNYAKGNIWLLIIPLVRGLISLDSDFFNWLKKSYMDIIVIAVVFGMAWLKWYFVRFEICKKGIYVKSGVLLRKEILFPYAAISCAVFHIPFLLKPFGAMKLIINSDTSAAISKRNNEELVLIISETEYTQIYKNIPFKTSEEKLNFRISKKEVFLYSMCFSSTIPGLIYMVAFLVQSNRILGEKIEMELLSVVNELTEVIRKFFEDVIAIVIVLLIIFAVGWLMSVAAKIMRHLHFEISKCGEKIIIEKGHFSNWKYYVKYSRINTVEIRQNLLMKIAGKMSVHISCAGYGKRKDEQPVFIPLTAKKRAVQMIENLLPDFTLSNNLFRTKRTYIISYIWLPLSLIVGVAVLTVMLEKSLYEWNDAVKFIGIMIEIPLVYLLLVKIVAKISTGIGLSNNALTVNYCRSTRFYGVIIPKERITHIKIRRTIFQRASGCCDVIIYARDTHTRGHHVRGIVWSEALRLVRDYDNLC